MTRNVKTSAYVNLLGRSSDEFCGTNGKFVNEGQQIFNFASEDISKNTSTVRPARLHKPFSTYIESIGQISCGKIQGTCFLVTEDLVLTALHVCMDINKERKELILQQLEGANLTRRSELEKLRPHEIMPITITFDYLYPDKTAGVANVEVDEDHDPQLESSHLDYKFLRVKKDDALINRILLGSKVRSYPLQEGRAIVVGHPAGSELQEETCVVVSSHSWREKVDKRRAAVYPGVHMTNEQRMKFTEEYKEEERLGYDTSLFSGASGSPVFDLDGCIVAMHTQGYVLKVKGGNCSLMEFGVHFNAICADLRRRNYAVEKLFPNHDLERMDED
jgi:hypothetical protein